jgi:hypothetical protein
MCPHNELKGSCPECMALANPKPRKGSEVRLANKIARQQARLDSINERIGNLMSQRVDDEQILADLLRLQNQPKT